MNEIITTDSTSLQEVTEGLALFGLSIEARGAGLYDVRGPSMLQPERSIYRLVRVNIEVLRKLASATAQHRPTKDHKARLKIQRAIIHSVFAAPIEERQQRRKNERRAA